MAYIRHFQQYFSYIVAVCFTEVFHVISSLQVNVLEQQFSFSFITNSLIHGLGICSLTLLRS